MKKLSVEDIYNMDYGAYTDFLADLDESLEARGPDMMFEIFDTFGVDENTVVLDAGCRDARHLCRLAKRYHCTCEGIDLVDINIQSGLKIVQEEKLTDYIKLALGDIQDLPYQEDTFDIIWCRDVLSHIKDLKIAFEGFNRVLKPGGRVLIFHVLKTDLLTDEESEKLASPLATVEENLNGEYFEKSFLEAGFKCLEKIEIASEWREFQEESGANQTSKQLMRIGKLLRNKAYYIEKFGEMNYEAELANCHWGVYQLLGKLCPVIYVLTQE